MLKISEGAISNAVVRASALFSALREPFAHGRDHRARGISCLVKATWDCGKPHHVN